MHVPQQRHGHINFVVCSKEGKIDKIIFSKKYQESYREAREAKWGDSLSELPSPEN
jgi:ribosomal protein RSM22 (predicted rRNA methylase)